MTEAVTEAIACAAPRRVKLSRELGWRMPENTVSVARPGRWGNPWEVWKDHWGRWYVTRDGQHIDVPDRATGQAVAVNLYTHMAIMRAEAPGGAEDLQTLRGKNLACWCALGEPCHADVLLGLANGVGFAVSTEGEAT